MKEIDGCILEMLVAFMYGQNPDISQQKKHIFLAADAHQVGGCGVAMHSVSEHCVMACCRASVVLTAGGVPPLASLTAPGQQHHCAHRLGICSTS